MAPTDRRVAVDAGLRYVSDEKPGLTRRRHGKGFTYRAADGSTVTDRRVRQRIEALVIPPAWTDVWISPLPNGHILATGRDQRGRKQYLYHPTWRELRDAHKFAQLGDFGRRLPDLRAELEANLRGRMSRRKVLSLVVRLLDETLIRVGNPEYVEANESYGLTTLSPDHVTVEDDTIEFDFAGKSGLQHEFRVTDPKLAALVAQCHELEGQELFSYRPRRGSDDVASISSSDVNEFLQQHLGPGVTAKSFRTWGATRLMTATLSLNRPPDSETEAEKGVLAAYDVVAANLGNTRTVTRASYVHPAIPEAFRTGALATTWSRSRAGKHLDRSERTVLRLLDA